MTLTEILPTTIFSRKTAALYWLILMDKIKPCVSCPVISFPQVGETQGEVEGSGWVHPECHLLKRLTFSKEGRKAEGRPVAQAVAKLRVPGVNQKLHFQIIRQIQFESETKQQLDNEILVFHLPKMRTKATSNDWCLLFIPVKIYASASDDCSSFVDVIDFYHAIQVADASLGPPASSQSSTRE